MHNSRSTQRAGSRLSATGWCCMHLCPGSARAGCRRCQTGPAPRPPRGPPSPPPGPSPSPSCPAARTKTTVDLSDHLARSCPCTTIPPPGPAPHPSCPAAKETILLHSDVVADIHFTKLLQDPQIGLPGMHCYSTCPPCMPACNGAEPARHTQQGPSARYTFELQLLDPGRGETGVG